MNNSIDLIKLSEKIYQKVLQEVAQASAENRIDAINELKGNSDYAKPKAVKEKKTSSSSEKKTSTKASSDTVTKKEIQRLNNVISDLSQKVDALAQEKEKERRVKELLAEILKSIRDQANTPKVDKTL